MSFKLDLHIHSESHGRTFINDEQLLNALTREKIDGVAITNFTDISHAQWLKKKLKDHIIIIGQEVLTTDGHVIGLGLKEKIPDFLSAEETIGIIHEQSGFTVAVHPYLHLGLGKKAFDLSFDAVEVYNGIIGGFFIYNYLAKRLAQQMGVAQLASTDTTDATLIGRTFTKIMTDDCDSIFEAIRSGNVRLFKRAVPIPFIFILKSILKCRDLEPWLAHAIPCFVCGKSMTVRLFKKNFECLDCGEKEQSRIACCNGHYVCIKCMIGRMKKQNEIASEHGLEIKEAGN